MRETSNVVWWIYMFFKKGFNFWYLKKIYVTWKWITWKEWFEDNFTREGWKYLSWK